MSKITVKDLFEAGCHFGHQTRRWNPKMKPYVYGNRNGITIIDLTKTITQIADACNFLQHVVSEGGKLLFVGTKPQARDIVKEAAEKTNMYYICERWMGGTLTNNVTIRKSIERMNKIDQIIAEGENKSVKKKEIAVLSHKVGNLHRDLDGIKNMGRLPDAIIVVDLDLEDIAVREANKLGIPVVALADTNSNPELVEYPIAANDDAVRSIQMIIGVLTENIVLANDVWAKKYEELKVAEAEAREKARLAKEAKAAEAGAKGEEDGEKRPRRRTPRPEGAAPAGDRPIRRRRTPRPEGDAAAAAAPRAPRKPKTDAE